MLGPIVPSKFALVCLATLVYSVGITVKLFNADGNCRPSCADQPSTACPATQPQADLPAWNRTLDFRGFDNETGTEDGRYLVPNFVHFVKFGQPEFTFVQAVCVLAAFKNQRPDKIFFHTDAEDGFRGKYWRVIADTPGFNASLVVRKMALPTEIFGQQLNKRWKYYHGGDVARLRVMMEFGGIYLDSDSYVVRSLDDFRRYEMALGWTPGRDMGNMVLVAHKSARFLRAWYDSYRSNYNASSWYYNAGTYPTRHILEYRPELVHRVPRQFGNYGIKQKTYLTAWPEWRDYYALHLLASRLDRGLKHPKLKYPVQFDEHNVLRYPVAFRDMCKAVYPFSPRNASDHG